VCALTHLSLFTGIGGLDLAAEMAGFQTIGQCEFADYPTKVLEKHWPDVPRWRDIRELTKGDFYERTGLRTVDILSGGFPCQPFSVAGKRRGREDDRYLWPEMLRVIKELRPRWIVGENVAGIVNMALDTVLSDLESTGYTGQAFIIPACAVDAPHRRDRVAIVANFNGIRRDLWRLERERIQRGYETCDEADSGGKTMAHANRERELQQAWKQPERRDGACDSGQNVAYADNGSGIVWRNGELSTIKEAKGSGENHGGRTQEYVAGERGPVKPGLGRVAYGFSTGLDGTGWRWPDEPLNVPRIAQGVKNRVGRLKCLGNAVVPRQFYPIFAAIDEIERSIKDG